MHRVKGKTNKYTAQKFLTGQLWIRNLGNVSASDADLSTHLQMFASRISLFLQQTQLESTPFNLPRLSSHLLELTLNSFHMQLKALQGRRQQRG